MSSITFFCVVWWKKYLHMTCINNSTWAIAQRVNLSWLLYIMIFASLFYPLSLFIYSKAHGIVPQKTWNCLYVWDCQFSVFALAESCSGWCRRWWRRVSAGELNAFGADGWVGCDRCGRGFSLWLCPSRAPSHTSSSKSTCSRRSTALNLRAAR